MSTNSVWLQTNRVLLEALRTGGHPERGLRWGTQSGQRGSIVPKVAYAVKVKDTAHPPGVWLEDCRDPHLSAVWETPPWYA
jgi:hypothetical protein